MAIFNRELDPSQQKETFYYRGATGINITGTTGAIAIMPYPGVIQSARSFAQGVSGAMQVAFSVLRFAGGATVIGCGISNMILNEFGVSGIMGYSGLAVPGSTLLNVQAGDVLYFTTSVANTAAQTLMLEVVIKKTQDIVSYNGVQT